MTMRATRCSTRLRSLLLLVLCWAGVAGAQPLATLGTAPPPVLVMVARSDPGNPGSFVPIAGDVTDAIALFRLGRREPAGVPFQLDRGDEIETAAGVVAVLRYPVGDVYVDGATRARIGSLDVLFGKIFARVRGLFSVGSQNLVAGVEGTEFAFEVAQSGDANVTVLDGAVLCSSPSLPWKPVRITRGLTFEVVSSGREFRVTQANPDVLAELQRLVRSVEVVAPPPTATPPSPPTPLPPAPLPPMQPPPVQPPPSVPVPPPVPAPPPFGSPMPPAPPTYPPFPIPIPVPIPVPQPPPAPSVWGYCCEAGRVVNTTAEACRGSFHRSQSAAYESCRPQMSGYCCANGRVFVSSPGNCRGSYFADEASARRSCATPTPPKPQQGYCCAGGRVVQSTRESCHGQFYTDQASAQKLCTAPPPSPELGYCCSGGQVSSTTRDRCTGSFHRSQQEAKNACARISDSTIRGKRAMETVPVVPRSDAPR
jgi:hypothetical protein